MGIFYQKIKNRVTSRLLAKIRVSQVFWEPIKNRVSATSALLEVAYLKALLYLNQQKKEHSDYSKALRYTASRSADLGDARFLIGSQNT